MCGHKHYAQHPQVLSTKKDSCCSVDLPFCMLTAGKPPAICREVQVSLVALDARTWVVEELLAVAKEAADGGTPAAVRDGE